MTFELMVQKEINFNDGTYKGKIVEVKRRMEPYDYADFYIQEDNSKVDLKYSCPAKLSKNTKLGTFLSWFIEFKEGEKVNLEQLIGKKVQFSIINKKSKRDGKVYAEIIDGSVKPYTS